MSGLMEKTCLLAPAAFHVRHTQPNWRLTYVKKILIVKEFLSEYRKWNLKSWVKENENKNCS
jgi:hypothetical protein